LGKKPNTPLKPTFYNVHSCFLALVSASVVPRLLILNFALNSVNTTQVAKYLLSNPHVVKLPLGCAKTCFDVPQAFSVGELGKDHRKILVPTGKSLDLVVPAMTLYALMEFICGQKIHKLSKDGLSRVHAPSPSGMIQKYGAEEFSNSNLKMPCQSKTIVAVDFMLSPEINVGTAVTFLSSRTLPRWTRRADFIGPPFQPNDGRGASPRSLRPVCKPPLFQTTRQNNGDRRYVRFIDQAQGQSITGVGKKLPVEKGQPGIAGHYRILIDVFTQACRKDTIFEEMAWSHLAISK
jgi:hypothetical protein